MQPKRLAILVFTLVAGVLLTLGIFGSCTGSNFSGSAKKNAAPKGGGATPGGDPSVPPGLDPGKPNPKLETPPGKDDDDDDDGGGPDEDEDQPIRIFPDDFNGASFTKKLEPQQKNFLWVVTAKGTVDYMRLEGTEVKSKKRWTGATGGGGGSRTYVTEGGLVVARTGGHLYFIDPEKTPEGALDKTDGETYYKLDGPADADRVCVVSYRKDKKRYLGMGYGAGMFVEFSMEDKPPYAPNWGDKTGKAKADTTKWGYSCFIDQNRLIYYSQWVAGAPVPGMKVGAVDLEKMQGTDPKDAPNGDFASSNLKEATVGPRSFASYAMNGDRDGNVLNGTGFYTLAYEPESRTVWGAAGGMLNVYPAKCLSSDETCSGHAGFAMAQLNANVGPLSALGDGSMAGMLRAPTGNGAVFILQLKDKKDISQGVDVTRVADTDGDPYMYTDFTGATLYLTKTQNTFDLTDAKKFDTSTPNRAVGFAWARRGAEKSWKDIKLEIRCYSGDDKGDYETFEGVKDAMEQTVIQTESCKEKKYEKVDIRLTQLNDGDSLMNVRAIQVTGYK